MPFRSPVLLLLIASLPIGSAWAQEAESPEGLSIELNSAVDATSGCTLSFLITNDRQYDIQEAVYEIVLFGGDGHVDRLTLLDFGALPAGRPRVRQFTLGETACDGISRILLNGATTCEAGDVGVLACMDGLGLSSRIDIELIG